MVVHNFLTCKEIRDKSVIYRHYLPSGNTESVRYIRKFDVSEFVIRVTICKDF